MSWQFLLSMLEVLGGKKQLHVAKAVRTADTHYRPLRGTYCVKQGSSSSILTTIPGGNTVRHRYCST